MLTVGTVADEYVSEKTAVQNAEDAPVSSVLASMQQIPPDNVFVVITIPPAEASVAHPDV